MTVFFDIMSLPLQTYKAIDLLVPFLYLNFNICITILGMFMYAILFHFCEIGIIIPWGQLVIGCELSEEKCGCMTTPYKGMSLGKWAAVSHF